MPSLSLPVSQEFAVYLHFVSALVPVQFALRPTSVIFELPFFSLLTQVAKFRDSIEF